MLAVTLKILSVAIEVQLSLIHLERRILLMLNI